MPSTPYNPSTPVKATAYPLCLRLHNPALYSYKPSPSIPPSPSGFQAEASTDVTHTNHRDHLSLLNLTLPTQVPPTFQCSTMLGRFDDVARSRLRPTNVHIPLSNVALLPAQLPSPTPKHSHKDRGVRSPPPPLWPPPTVTKTTTSQGRASRQEAMIPPRESI